MPMTRVEGKGILSVDLNFPHKRNVAQNNGEQRNVFSVDSLSRKIENLD